MQFIVQGFNFPGRPRGVAPHHRGAGNDKSLITEAFLDDRMQVLQAPGYAEYFRAMFTDGLQRYIDQAVMSPDQPPRLDCDVIMMHGRKDLPIPAANNSLALGGMLPRADIMIVGRCGHSPALEHPDKLLACAAMLFG